MKILYRKCEQEINRPLDRLMTLLINGLPMTLCTAAELHKLLPHLSVSAIAKRINLLKKANFIVVERLDKLRFYQGNYIGICNQEIEQLIISEEEE